MAVARRIRSLGLRFIVAISITAAKSGETGDRDEPSRVECLHCGTLFRLRQGTDREFCCAGCRFVHQLIDQEGLERFYHLKGSDVMTPVKSLAFQERDWTWLQSEVEVVEADLDAGQAAKKVFEMQGLSCVACVWLIEKLFQRQSGALRIVVDTQRGRVTLWWQAGKFAAADFARELLKFGYAMGPVGVGSRDDVPQSRELATRTGVAGALAMNAMVFTLPSYLGMKDDFLLAGIFDLITLASATIALFVGGGYFFGRAWRAMAAGSLHMDLPISIGLITAYVGSVIGWLSGMESLKYFDFVAVFAFLMLAGRWIQQTALEKNKQQVLSGDLSLREVLIENEEGGTHWVAVEELKKGQYFLLKPGDPSPVSARLDRGDGDFSFEWINGEPEARTLRQGSEIPGGAMNVGRAALPLLTLDVFAGSRLEQLVSGGEGLVESSRDLGRVLQWYLIVVLVVALLGALAWLGLAHDGARAFQVFISVLVVSCPCALGLALPFLDELIVSRLRRSGVFIQKISLWSRLKRVRRVVFDKTGTLTLDAPKLTNPGVLDHLNEDERAALVNLLEGSYHPIARALREELASRGWWRGDAKSAVAVGSVEESVGCGVSWCDGLGVTWTLGKAGWKDSGRSAKLGKAQERGGDVASVFARDGNWVAGFEFEEALREDACDEIRMLSDMGYELGILSGDREERVMAIAKMLGIDPQGVQAGLNPVEKADWIRRHDPETILYIGDGANDSLAFDAAACRGTPAVGTGVLESRADFYFLGRGLHAIRELLSLVNQRQRTIRLILIVAVSYNVLAVAICLVGWMNPLLAAILMPLSSLAALFLANTVKA